MLTSFLFALAFAPSSLQGQTPLPNNRIKEWPNGSEMTREEKVVENAKRNTGLKIKDALKASDTKPVDLVLAGKENVRIKQKGKVVLKKLPPEKMTANEKYDVTLDLSSGTVLTRGSKAFRGTTRFTVEASNVGISNAADGTSFAVTVENGQATVVVAEGIVTAQNTSSPGQSIEIRHGEKAQFGGAFPYRASQITVADLEVYRELLQLAASGADEDLRNDIAGADISELYTKKWDPNGRWMAKPFMVPRQYTDEFTPSLINVVRFDRPAGATSARESKFFSVDETGKRVDFPDGWYMQEITPDGKFVLATSPEKGLWAFDFNGVLPPRQISPKPLDVFSISPDGKRIVAEVGYPVKEGKRDSNGRTDGNFIHIGMDGKSEYLLYKREQWGGIEETFWFEGGKRLIVKYSGEKSLFIDGDSPTQRIIYEGEGELSPATGKFIFATGWQTTRAYEYIITRTADGKQWTGRLNKPFLNPPGGNWGAEDSIYFANQSQALRMGDPPSIVANNAQLDALRYRRIPQAFSPDGKFFAYVESETERLIIGDCRQPQRIFDTGVILFPVTSLTWLPVGDTIAYKSEVSLGSYWEPGQETHIHRQDIAGFVELGAIKYPGHPEFTANPRRDSPITVVSPASLEPDGFHFAANGGLIGTLKYGMMSAFSWTERDGITELFDPSFGDDSTGNHSNDRGDYVGFLNDQVYVKSGNTLTMIPEFDMVEGISNSGKIIGVILEGELQKAAVYDMATKKITKLDSLPDATMPLAINNKDEIVYQTLSGGTRLFFRDASGLTSPITFASPPQSSEGDLYNVELNENGVILVLTNSSLGISAMGPAKSALKTIDLPEGYHPFGRGGLNNKNEAVMLVQRPGPEYGNDIIVYSEKMVLSLRQYIDFGFDPNRMVYPYDFSDDGKIAMITDSPDGGMSSRVAMVVDTKKLKLPVWAPKGIPTWLDELPVNLAAPGFKILASSKLMDSGVRGMYGRPNVLIMHPVDRTNPAVIEREIAITPQHSTLAFSVRSFGAYAPADWMLGVSVNGVDALTTLVNSPAQWRMIRVDLKDHIGKTIKVRIEARCGGQDPWNCEAGYFSSIRFTNDPEGTEPKESVGPNLLEGKTGKDAVLYNTSTGKGVFSLDGDGFRVDNAVRTNNPYNVQAYFLMPEVEIGAIYEVRFQARADKAIQMGVWCQGHLAPFATYGLQVNDVALQTDWKYFSYRFTATNVQNPSRLPAFMFGHTIGTVWVRDVSVRKVTME